MNKLSKTIYFLIITSLILSCSYVDVVKSTVEGEFPNSMLNTKKNVPIDEYSGQKNINTLIQSADVFFENGQYDKAYDEYVKALRLAPDNRELYYEAGISQINYFIQLRDITTRSDKEQVYALFKAYYLLSEAIFRGSTKAQSAAEKYLNRSYRIPYTNEFLWMGGNRYWKDNKFMERERKEVFNN